MKWASRISMTFSLSFRTRERSPPSSGGTFSSNYKGLAQFIAVCSNAKTCEIGENLLSVSDPISRLQERLIHVGALIRPPTLQRRPVSGLHSYAAMERSAPPVSPVPAENRVGLNNVCNFLEGLLAEFLADFGQYHAFGICQPHTASELIAQDTILGHQILVAQQQFLIDSPCNVCEQCLPIHALLHFCLFYPY